MNKARLILYWVKSAEDMECIHATERIRVKLTERNTIFFQINLEKKWGGDSQSPDSIWFSKKETQGIGMLSRRSSSVVNLNSNPSTWPFKAIFLSRLAKDDWEVGKCEVDIISMHQQKPPNSLSTLRKPSREIKEYYDREGVRGIPEGRFANGQGREVRWSEQALEGDEIIATIVLRKPEKWRKKEWRRV